MLSRLVAGSDGIAGSCHLLEGAAELVEAVAFVILAHHDNDLAIRSELEPGFLDTQLP